MGNLKKQVVNGLGTLAGDLTDRILISHRRKTEIKKMEDPRRVEIRESVTLTEKQKKEIDEYFMTYYGEKVPHTWHQYFTAYTGQFDVRYFPELLYIPEFEYFMNQRQDYQRVFADKNVIPMIARSVGVRSPKVFLSVAVGVFKDGDGNLISKEEAVENLRDIGEAFIKPTVDTMSGNGCAVINVRNGIDEISGEQLARIIDKMGPNFVIQERVRCHATIAKLYANSVNTFRIFTYRWKGKIEHIPLIMRIGQRGGTGQCSCRRYVYSC